MKSLNTTVLLGLLLINALSAQIPTAGLFTKLEFNGNTNDGSGNNFNFTNYGATLTTDRFGQPNNAYEFDGSNYLSRSANSDINILGDDISISYWYNTAYVNNKAGIIDNSQATTPNGYAIDLYNGYRFLGGNNFQSTTITTSTDNTWHHIVFTKNGSKGIFYVDGIPTDSTNSMAALTPATLYANYSIGRRNNNTYYYKGKLDDIFIYNRTLDPSEVLGLYNYTPPVSLTQDLAADFSFAGNFEDKSGNARNLNGTNIRLTSDRFGNVNNAILLDGTSSYLEANSTSDFSANRDSLTLSYWYYTTNSNTNAVIIDNNEASTTNGFGFDLVNGHRFTGAGNHTVGNNIQTNGWHHVAYTKHQNIGTLYIDGNLIDATQSLNTTTAHVFAEKLNIGRNSSGNNYFEGKLDDIKIYYRSLSSTEILALFNASNPINNPDRLIAKFLFNGNTADSSLTPATNTDNLVTYVNDRFGNPSSAASFDTHAYISADLLGAYNYEGDSITISYWYNSTYNNVNSGVIDNTQPATGNGFAIDLYQGTRFLGGNNYTTSSAYIKGNWHHIVFTKDGTDAKFYLDGVEISNTNGMTPLSENLSSYFFNIGRRNNGNSYFYGELDDIYIYSRALSGTEVLDLFNENNITTGIAKSRGDEIMLYPSIATNFVTIAGIIQDTKIEVYSVNGKLMKSITSAQASLDINLQNYASGIYMVRITNDDGLVTKKFIKK